MTPLWVGLVRRNRQAAAALVVLAALAALHGAVFAPLHARFRRDLELAERLGMSIGGPDARPVASSRVAALLAGASLNGAVAEEQGNSGVLTAALLDEATRLSTRQGLEVVATEQGVVTQLAGSVQVRAHLTLRGHYAAFVDLLGALSRSDDLVSVDRFAIQARSDGRQDIEVWVSQLILKRTGSPR